MPTTPKAGVPAYVMPSMDTINSVLQRRKTLAARRCYVGRPAAYISDRFGFKLTPGQEEALDLIEANDRVLIPSANNQGKTHLIAAYGLYRFDIVAAVEDEDNGLAEQGARILLPGPDEATIKSTIYSEMLAHA